MQSRSSLETAVRNLRLHGPAGKADEEDCSNNFKHEDLSNIVFTHDYASASKYAPISWVPSMQHTAYIHSIFNLHPTSLNQPPEGHEISLPSLCPWKCLRPWPSLVSSALARAPGAPWGSTPRRLHWTALRGLGTATRWCLASRLHFLIERNLECAWWPAMASILASKTNCVSNVCNYMIPCVYNMFYHTYSIHFLFFVHYMFIIFICKRNVHIIPFHAAYTETLHELDLTCACRKLQND